MLILTSEIKGHWLGLQDKLDSIPAVQFARCDSVGLPNAHDKAGVSLKWWSQGSAPTGLSAAHNNHCIDSQEGQPCELGD